MNITDSSAANSPAGLPPRPDRRGEPARSTRFHFTKTRRLLRPTLTSRWALAAVVACRFLGSEPLHAQNFSTGPQREAVDTASKELDAAAAKAAKAQQNGPADAGQEGINDAEDAADAARDAANRANDAAERARETAAEKAKAAKGPDEIKAARDAERAAKEAADRGKEAEKTAKDREADTKKAVNDAVKVDEGIGRKMNRRIIHEARQGKRDARRRLADRIRELQRTWADTKIDPKKKGVTITEEERRKTEKAINEGRRDLGWEEIEVLASMPVLPADNLTTLVAAHKIQTEITGTGKTIGVVANIRVKNLTAEKISVTLPPVVLESRSRKHQHYVCPRGETIALNPQEEQVIKERGICISRSKPPVADGVGGDLVINDGHPTGEKTTFKPAQVDKLIRCVTSYYDGAEKLEKEGKLAKVPYKDPEMRKEIVTQWGVWSDPKICTVTKETPATKEDLTKTVYRQTEEKTPVTPEIKKKLDTGITDIFTSIQLTTKEAKELEPASPYTEVRLADEQASGDAPEPEPQEHEETAVNPDGTRTTTTTRTDGHGVTYTTVRTKYPDGTERTVTSVTHKSGSTITQTTERDGSTTQITHGIPDDDGRQTDSTVTIDKKTDTKTMTTVTVEKDGTKTTKTTKTEASGQFPKTKGLARETINPDGSKESFQKNEDGSWTSSTTDKNGKTATSSGDGKGKATGKTAKGTYTEEPQPDGAILVKWDLPSGTGGAKTFPKGTEITPNASDDNNPLPFKTGRP